MKVRHALYFETEFTGEQGEYITSTYSETDLRHMLELMLKDLLVPRIQPALDELNENGSYAILRVAE